MLGEPRPQRPRVEVLLESPLKRTPGRTEFARARLARRNGQLFAQPLARQSSGALSSMINVDALLEIPAERAELAAGTAMNAILIRELRV
jgi:molybdopterin molybdotransferase